MKEFSALLGVGYETYRKVEQGERSVNVRLEKKLEEYLMSRRSEKPTGLDGKIDYLRVRFRTMDYKSIIDKVLRLEDKPFVREKGGRYSYDAYVRFGDINIYYSTTNYSMGTLVEFSGSGCRQFEWYMQHEQDRDWEIFLLDCFGYASKFCETASQVDSFMKVTRIDIALDELFNEDGNYDLFKLKEKKDNKLLKTKSKAFRYIDKLKNDEYKGKSLYFGSENSSVVLNFYEKDLEQANKLGVPVSFIHSEFGYKNRYEVRLLDKTAHLFVKKWLEEFDGYNLADKAVWFINDRLHVYKRSRDGLRLDDEWYRLMGSYGSFKFTMRPEKYEPGVKEYRWIESSVAPTLKYLFELEGITGVKKLWTMIEEAKLNDEQERLLKYLSYLSTEDNEDVEDVEGYKEVI